MDRTTQVDADAKKQQTGFQKLMSAINISDLPTLEDYKSKIEKSDKYTDDQKVEFVLAAEQRIAELKKEA